MISAWIGSISSPSRSASLPSLESILYLTVFVTGLAIHFHWITLAPAYQSLDVLGNPWIIIVAGILYFLEFFADKIPWVDSIWDAVHTVIRPIGGALLAIQVLGHPNPAFTVIVALLGGGTSLISHTAKAATRLTTNTSPEPFSNIALSVGEDAAVLGGLALIHYNPVRRVVDLRGRDRRILLLRAEDSARNESQALAGMEKIERAGRF